MAFFDLGGPSIVEVGEDFKLDKLGPTPVVGASKITPAEYALRLQEELSKGDVPFVDMAAALEQDRGITVEPIPVVTRDLGKASLTLANTNN